MSEVNLKSLAKELGLSVSTVSRALRDAYDISAETRQRVQALAAERNYVANPYASSLRKNQSKTIGVIIPNVVNNFFSLAINGIESVAQQKNYHVLIYLTHEDYEKEKQILNHLQSGRVDGILLSMASETKDQTHIKEFQKNGLPLVFFDRASKEIEASKVSTDDFESAFEATEHLIQNGCKRIAHLCISKSLSIIKDRLRGYSAALEKNGIPFDDTIIKECEDDDQLSYQQIATLFSDKDRPDGIFASVEKLAIIAYQVCIDLGLCIPEEVKIISFSNLSTASLLNPALTTVMQPAFEIGRTAATLLFKQLEKKRVASAPETVVIKSELIRRRSSSAS
ncbi:LacI family DNA-binding transcriptional regulator [Flavisolibacter nicotianae]|uniref:LacI family DNA-binding transcriptional regulator n=1 Tax=Flavisolibacter nicotianae TaxID=2364882 RepID=UPI000EB19F7F|nr:LacI family DNA-binding transcriptional regulator [Flavisolibacter nicotianae]